MGTDLDLSDQHSKARAELLALREVVEAARSSDVGGEMTTLRETLDEWGTGLHDAPDLRDAIESWAYGEERECPACEGRGLGAEEPAPGRIGVQYNPCPTCHGTGKTREPGLVERLRTATTGVRQDPRQEVALKALATQRVVLDLLRQELGEVTR